MKKSILLFTTLLILCALLPHRLIADISAEAAVVKDLEPLTNSILDLSFSSGTTNEPDDKLTEQTQKREPLIVFKNVNVLSMTGKEILKNGVVIIKGNIIATIGSQRKVRIPKNAHVIDGKGQWLMPGLVDAHLHLVGIPEIDTKVSMLAVAFGVTTAIEMGGAGQPGDSTRLMHRKQIIDGTTIGPTYYLGSPKANDATLTFEDGVNLVNNYKNKGYDFIKVYNKLSAPGYRGILVRANQLGMPVLGHVVRSVGLLGTLGSGQRGIVHMEEYLYEYFGYKSTDTTQITKHVLKEAAIPYLAQITKQAGVYVTPNLIPFERILAQTTDLDSVLRLPQMQYVPAPLWEGNYIKEVNIYPKLFHTEKHRTNLREGLSYLYKLTTAMYKAGVPFLVGTDAHLPAVVAGYDLHEEMQHMVKAGMKPYDVLLAATRNAADYLNKDDFGTIEAGKRADLLLLSANPLDNISNTKKIEGVMVRGKWLDKSKIDSMLKDVTKRE